MFPNLKRKKKTLKDINKSKLYSDIRLDFPAQTAGLWHLNKNQDIEI